MYSTTIKNTYSYFGKNPSTLKEGYIQQMYSQEGDESLFLDAPPHDCENNKYQKQVKKKKHKLMIKEFEEKLSEQE
jgi:hypothetical protein